ncbi:MAG TPA: ATP-binding protein [Symbiobacteriaceae bacterium]
MVRPERWARPWSLETWQPYAAVVLLVGAASAISALVVGTMAPVNLVMIYLLVVVISGLRWGLGPAVLASILGVLAFDFFFVPPRLSFTVHDAQYLMTFAALLVVALVIGTLTGRLRNHAAMLHRRERETAALYAFSRSMVVTRSVTEIAGAVIGHVARCFDRPVALQVQEAGRRDLRTVDFGVGLTPAEQEAARWVLDHGQPVGRSGTAGADLSVDCIPLKTGQGIVGVLVVRHRSASSPLSPDEHRLLEAFAAQAAVVLERARLAETARKAELLMETDKLQQALLHSISHSLRTPLASIIGGLTTVLDPGQEQLDAETRHDLLDTAREEAERLNWLVSNLLDMTRVESGHLKLNIDQYDLEDVIGAALGQTAVQLKDHPVRVQIAAELPLVSLDQVLVVQVLDNLIDNAAKYSQPGASIDIAVKQADDSVAVTVADRGVGVSEQDATRIFDKFYRVERPGSPSGTGLGLAICKGIVEAHGGRIWACPREGGGAEITFSLPIHPGSSARS